MGGAGEPPRTLYVYSSWVPMECSFLNYSNPFLVDRIIIAGAHILYQQLLPISHPCKILIALIGPPSYERIQQSCGHAAAAAFVTEADVCPSLPSLNCCRPFSISSILLGEWLHALASSVAYTGWEGDLALGCQPSPFGRIYHPWLHLWRASVGPGGSDWPAASEFRLDLLPSTAMAFAFTAAASTAARHPAGRRLRQVAL